MNIFRSLNGRWQTWRKRSAERRLLLGFSGPAEEISRADWMESLSNPTGFYDRCLHYYQTRLPEPLREHRAWFEQRGRGFGEKAFHTMWFLLFQEFQPDRFLEIGVFRGQTLSLAALLARHFERDCLVQGISPFSPAGDSVSRYRRGVDFYEDTLDNFAHFSLPTPKLVRAYSTDPLAHESVAGSRWSCIYIDGNHDYEVARQDWNLCAAHVQPGGIIVLDDAGLTTPYVPPIFATGGHPGPSRLAGEIDRQVFCELLQVGHNRVFQKIVQ